MIVKVPYGNKMLDLDLKSYKAEVCAATDVEPQESGVSLIRKALARPIGTKSLSELAKGRKDVCIVINDVTRPTPSQIILEGILEELHEAGVKDEQINILISNGNHRPATQAELIKMIGEDYVSRFNIVNHVATNDDDLTYLGDTPLGVPIHVNSCLAKSDIKILTGTIRPHQSAGYSGGRKSVLPGVAGLASIRKHHSFPIFPLSPQLGVIENNTFHEQSLLGAKFVGIDFIVNVIENSHGQIMDAVAGDLELAHAKGVGKCSAIWTYELPEKVDIVITSPGGYPKDINLHQSQKAVAPCELILKEGGIIILVAECPDGAGDVPTWFDGLDTPQEVVEKFKRDGWSPKAHAKPFLLARPLSNFTMITVCEGISEETLKNMFMIPANNIQAAFEKALSICKNPNPSVLVLPYAGDVIPQAGFKDIK